jgi:hypothetical protein
MREERTTSAGGKTVSARLWRGMDKLQKPSTAIDMKIFRLPSQVL